MASAIYQQEQRAYWATINIIDLSRDKAICINEGKKFDEQSEFLLFHYQKVYYDALYKLSFLYGLNSKNTTVRFFKKYPELKEL